MDRPAQRSLTRPLADLRHHLLDIVTATLRSIDSYSLTTAALRDTSVRTFVEGRPLAIVAAGKASAGMVRAVLASGVSVARGIVAAPEGPPPGVQFTWYTAGHPLPTGASEEAARAALELAAGLREDDRLLVLVSGGASALLAAPVSGLDLAAKRQAVAALLAAGVPIHELNAVRKHLSAVKGGRLAAAGPAHLLTLAISDVVAPVADDPSVIGSGPTVPDPTSFADALQVVHTAGVISDIPETARRVLEEGARGERPETPKPGEPRVERTAFRVIGSRYDAMYAVRDRAAELGYETILMEAPVVGEAREAGRELAATVARRTNRLPRPTALVTSGETTVRVVGDGRGGRNQELALGFALASAQITRPFAIASIGTDGIDGPTDAAGAVLHTDWRERARVAGVDAAACLARNDAYTFFHATNGLIRTGYSGTNVGDLQVVLLG